MKLKNKVCYVKGFLSMLFGKLRASLLGDILTGQGIVRAGYGNERQDHKNKMGF